MVDFNPFPLGRDGLEDVFAVVEDLGEPLVAAEVRQDSEFELRVVGGQDEEPFGGDHRVTHAHGVALRLRD